MAAPFIVEKTVLPAWWRALYPCVVITTRADSVRPVHHILGIHPDGQVEAVAWTWSASAAAANARSMSSHLPGSVYVQGGAG